MLQRITKLCKERGISVRQLEKTLGFGNGTISKWDRFEPTFNKVIKIAAYFGISLDELVYGKRKQSEDS